MVIRLPISVVLACAMVAGVSGCAWVKEWPPRDTPVKTSADMAAPQPQMKLMQTADATWLTPAAKNEPPVQHMVPANGEQATTINRVKELENELAAMRAEMSTMAPAVNRLAETQTKMRDTLAAAIAPAAGVTAGTVATGTVAPVATLPPAAYDNAGVYAAKTVPASLAPSTVNPDAAYVPPRAHEATIPSTLPPPAATAPAGPSVSQVRFTESKGKTRIVLDAAQPTPFTYALDSAQNILTIRLPSLGWTPVPADQVADSGLAAAYTATADGAGGTILSVQLRKPAKVALAQALPPGGGKGHRVVFDLAPL